VATWPGLRYGVARALGLALVVRTQSQFGRRISFQIGLAVALGSACLAAWAVVDQNCWLLVAATVVAGYYSANGQLYRFAAAELVPAPQREKAVSLVLAGGLLGAIVGPNLAARSRTLLETPFAGAYVVLAGVAILAMLLMAAIRFPEVPASSKGQDTGRPLSEIMRNPVFMVACASAALGYGVMNLLMAATPLAMQQCGLSFDDAALVLEWHVIGMFAPGFFTGGWIKRFGTLPVRGLWALVVRACMAVAVSGGELHQCGIALLLLGVDWYLIFTGSTTLSLGAYRPEEKDRAQAAINFCVFAVMAFTSFASGALVTTQGWSLLNWGSLVPVLLTALALAWLAARSRVAVQRN